MKEVSILVPMDCAFDAIRQCSCESGGVEELGEGRERRGQMSGEGRQEEREG